MDVQEMERVLAAARAAQGMSAELDPGPSMQNGGMAELVSSGRVGDLGLPDPWATKRPLFELPFTLHTPQLMTVYWSATYEDFSGEAPDNAKDNSRPFLRIKFGAGKVFHEVLCDIRMGGSVTVNTSGLTVGAELHFHNGFPVDDQQGFRLGPTVKVYAGAAIGTTGAHDFPTYTGASEELAQNAFGAITPLPMMATSVELVNPNSSNLQSEVYLYPRNVVGVTAIDRLLTDRTGAISHLIAGNARYYQVRQLNAVTSPVTPIFRLAL